MDGAGRRVSVHVRLTGKIGFTGDTGGDVGAGEDGRQVEEGTQVLAQAIVAAAKRFPDKVVGTVGARGVLPCRRRRSANRICPRRGGRGPVHRHRNIVAVHQSGRALPEHHGAPADVRR